MVEITIIVSDSEQTLKKKFLQQEGFCLSHDDPIITHMVQETMASFKGSCEDVILKIRADW